MENTKGFTLVELMVVLLVLGILVAMAVPLYCSVTERAKTNSCATNLRTMDGAAAQYYSAQGNWPTAGTAGVDDLVSANYLQTVPVCPTGGVYSFNASNHRFTCSVSGHTY